MYRSPLLDSACPVCKRGKNVYDYDYVLRPAETLAFTNDTFYKRLQSRFDYGWTNRKSRTLVATVHLYDLHRSTVLYTELDIDEDRTPLI